MDLDVVRSIVAMVATVKDRAAEAAARARSADARAVITTSDMDAVVVCT